MGDDGVGSCGDLAFIRITLLGCSGSGKTALTSSMSNNCMPASNLPTEEAALFYTTMKIGGNEDDTQSFNALLEIEDTVGTDRLEPNQLDQFFDLWYPSPPSTQKTSLPDKEITDDHGIKRDLLFPFGVYDAPLGLDYTPLTRNRMAFMLIFDVTDEKSYMEVCRIHDSLKEYWAKKDLKLKPVIMLVANKVDKDPLGEKSLQISDSATSFSEANAVPIFWVSALLFKGVKKLFRTAVQTVRINQQLWMPEFRDRSPEDQAGKACILQ